MAEPEQKRRCPTCKSLKPSSEFYEKCAECKDCKRLRSQRNRLLLARKVAAFERIVDALINLADPSTELELSESSVSAILASVPAVPVGAGQDAGPGTILAVRGQVTP